MERHPLQELPRRAGARMVEAEQTITARLAEPGIAARVRVKSGTPIAHLDASGPAALFELRMIFRPDTLPDTPPPQNTP